MRFFKCCIRWRQAVCSRRGNRSERGTGEQQNSNEDDPVEMVGSNAAWDWQGPGVNDVKPSAEEEGEESKEVPVSNRTVSKMK